MVVYPLLLPYISTLSRHHKVFQAQGGITLIPFHQVTFIVRLLFCPATAVNSALHDVYIEYLQVQIEVGASPGLVLKAWIYKKLFFWK